MISSNNHNDRYVMTSVAEGYTVTEEADGYMITEEAEGYKVTSRRLHFVRDVRTLFCSEGRLLTWEEEGEVKGDLDPWRIECREG